MIGYGRSPSLKLSLKPVDNTSAYIEPSSFHESIMLDTGANSHLWVEAYNEIIREMTAGTSDNVIDCGGFVWLA